MTKNIAQLWNGDFAPVEHSGTLNQTLKKLEFLMYDNLEKLEKSLSPAQKEMLEKYNDHNSEYISITNQQSFCDGFSLATKIVAEALLFPSK
ncbi:MAG: hypothetical protein IJN34_04710 [Clostridia bacterium]|nr:hypothetical protein [Clostridia bacterium]